MTQNKPTLAVCITSLGATQHSYTKIDQAIKKLEPYFEVILDKHLTAADVFGSRSASERIASLNWAFHVGDLIIAWDGGFNSIELLFEYEKIRPKRDKTFLGYSDNTVLVNAFAAKNACKTLYGPTLEDFIHDSPNANTTIDSLVAAYTKNYKKLSDLYNDRQLRVIRTGTAKGVILGGNNYSFDLLQGSEFCPNFRQPFILFIEGETVLKDKKYIWRDFIRNIDSIMLLSGARENLQGLLIGKFPSLYQPPEAEFRAFFSSRPYLRNVPIAVDLACGHAKDSFYLPIGEAVSIYYDLTKNNKGNITINKIDV